MTFIKENWKGMLLCLVIAIPSWIIGTFFPIIGGAVIAILAGMIVGLFLKNKTPFEKGIKFTSKKILQWAVILLGFGLNLNVIFKTGKQSLPIIVSTISTSLIIAFLLCKIMKIPGKISTLVGVGSSICGGSAIAATAPVIDADDEEVAQAISVIFFFNVLAALIFPTFGKLIGFNTMTGESFGIFAGTAVNDTSSVTACASTWDSMWNLGSETLDTAVTVKLTRTLAIIPITMILALYRMKKSKDESAGNSFSFKKVFPWFILFFVGASLITTVVGILPESGFSIFYMSKYVAWMKWLAKFFIAMAMSAIGLNTNIVSLIKKGGKPITLGFCCWAMISVVSILIQLLTGIYTTNL